MVTRYWSCSLMRSISRRFHSDGTSTEKDLPSGIHSWNAKSSFLGACILYVSEHALSDMTKRAARANKSSRARLIGGDIFSVYPWSFLSAALELSQPLVVDLLYQQAAKFSPSLVPVSCRHKLNLSPTVPLTAKD